MPFFGTDCVVLHCINI